MCAPIPFLLLQHYQGPIPRVILTLPHLGAKGALQKNDI
jgi:hypothetical protein